MVELDIKCDSRVPGVAKVQHRRLVEELRSACLILPVAYFEDFLYCLIAHFTQRLCSYRPQTAWSSLPDGLRKAVVCNSVRIMASWGFGDDLPATEARMFALFRELSSPSSDRATYSIPAEVIRSTKSNPNGATVVELMGLIGLKDLWNRISERLPALIPARLYGARKVYANPASIKNKLDDIVEERNRRAHGRTGAAKTRQEIEEQVDFLEHFSRALQQAVMAHLRGIRKSSKP